MASPLRLAAEYRRAGQPVRPRGRPDKLLERDFIQDNPRLTAPRLTSAYQFNKHWQVYFDAKNLLNTPLRYYRGHAQPWLDPARILRHVTFEAALVRAHF